MSLRTAFAATLVLALVAGCAGTQVDPGQSSATAASSTTTPRTATARTSTTPPATAALPQVSPDDPALDAALSEPRTDSVYPQVGDRGLDALHYGLDLHWHPRSRRLDGSERLVLRATADATTLRLDLGSPLEVGSVLLDGEQVPAEHRRDDLVIQAPVTEDSRHVLELTYAGLPEPVEAPTARSDFSTTGWTTVKGGASWTMQEPFGAYSWYAVDDQPADKALYDIAVTVPAPFVGVSGGTMTSRSTSEGRTRTAWHLDDPTASYLVTVATGRFSRHVTTTADGRRIESWTLPGQPAAQLRRVESAPAALDWLEPRVGRYPFDSLGFVVVDSESGMETQTMVTLGDTPYTTSRAVVLHELTHQWYGDQVTPDDWRDMWMNEGMTTYLQLLWESQHGGTPMRARMRGIAHQDRAYRVFAGPPGAYDADKFGDGNVYYLPALMWDQLRRRIGDRAFFSMVRAWPAARAGRSTDREDYLAWISERTGRDLGRFFEAWLLGERTPPTRGLGG